MSRLETKSPKLRIWWASHQSELVSYHFRRAASMYLRLRLPVFSHQRLAFGGPQLFPNGVIRIIHIQRRFAVQEWQVMGYLVGTQLTCVVASNTRP